MALAAIAPLFRCLCFLILTLCHFPTTSVARHPPQHDQPLLHSSSSSSASSSSASSSQASRGRRLHRVELYSEHDRAALRNLSCNTASTVADRPCNQHQRLVMHGAIGAAVKDPSYWRTWNTSTTLAPEYGFWRYVERVQLPRIPAPALNGTQVPNPGDKWIVITSIAAPTKDVIAWADWAKANGWTIVMVADTKTPADWSHPGVVFLSVADQQTMPLLSAAVIPYKNYGRKMLGYLYALSQGAQVIYETDDDNVVKPGFGLSWIKPEWYDGAVSTRIGSGPVNPYAHFGECTIWPRGFPLDELMAYGPHHCYTVHYGCHHSSAATRQPGSPAWAFSPVQQGLADLDPDVDAIWRLVYPNRIGSVHFKDEKPLLLARGSISPYNTQNTAHYRSAFWALWVPPHVNMRVTDIWRSYWAQRLLWEIDAGVLFVPSTVDQVRNAHDYVIDFEDELQMYIQASTMADFLADWRCSHRNMFDCMLELGHDMVLEGFLPPQDLHVLSAWVHDLAALGYQPPILTRAPRRTKQPQGHPAAADCHAPAPTSDRTAAAANAAPSAGLVLQHGHDKLALFVPATASFEAELKREFVTSLRLFYPLPQLRLLVVLEEDQPADVALVAPLQRELQALLPHAHVLVKLQAPNNYTFSGHDRQQFSMFWADTYSGEQEFIGFCDTDTVFITPVTHGDLFEGGKPVVIGLQGMPQGDFWATVPHRTNWFLKLPEVMRCMSYFPVILKARHLPLLRQYIEKVHKKSFNEVFLEGSRLNGTKAYSQFNIMCNYMWAFHRDEYAWHFQQSQPGWSGSVEGQMAAKELQELASDPMLSMPFPRVSQHWGYLASPPDDRHLSLALLEGFCLSMAATLSLHQHAMQEEGLGELAQLSNLGALDYVSVCSHFPTWRPAANHLKDVTEGEAVQRDLFMFEGCDWRWDPRVGAAQQQHYHRVALAGHTWNVELLQELERKLHVNSTNPGSQQR